MRDIDGLAIPDIHMDAARQARIEAAHGPHNVDTLELVRPVLFEDRRVLHGIFIRSGRAVDIARIRIPRGRRIWMVVRYLAALDDQVMRQHTAHRFMKTATDS